MQSTMLHGAPGIGKSQIAHQLRRLINAKLYDFRLATKQSSDVTGLPYYDHETQTTKYYLPEDLPRETDRPVIFLLEEISAAEPYLLPSIYGLLEERKMGNLVLGDNVMIIGLAPVLFRCVAYVRRRSFRTPRVIFHAALNGACAGCRSR